MTRQPPRVPTRMTPRTHPSSKIGGFTALGNPAVATAPDASDKIGSGSNGTLIYTYFTKPYDQDGNPTLLLYNADRLWSRVTLTLETAGPVAVGNASQLAPVLSGKGALLEPGMPTTFSVAKGTRLYVASTAVNRIKVAIEPLPWLEQITARVSRLADLLAGR